jgi:hypothetical protein
VPESARSIIPRVSVFPSAGLCAMSRNLSFMVLGTSLLAMSSCCCTEQGNHAVRKMWADYNTLRCPAFYLEQEDHLPYPAAQVAYYRWMYDKDPGHQLACLGKVPPRTCRTCDPVPPGDEPFEYEVLYPTGVPRQSDQLWGAKLPEPINVSHGPNLSEAPHGLGSSPANTPPTNVPVPAPILPPAPSPVNQAPTPGDLSNARRPAKTPSRLPSFDLPAPQPKPLDENPPPMLGPSSQQGPNLRLTTGQPLPSDLDSPPRSDAGGPR